MNIHLEWFKAAVIFLLGLEFGSFANVCIYRWPRSLSVNYPRRSICPWCEHQIAWIDNIPVFSFVFLRGRCRHCKSPISIRYPAVELTVALLWVAAFLVLNPSMSALGLLNLVAVLTFLFVAVVTTMTDFDWKIIPDEASLILVIAGLLCSIGISNLGSTPANRVLGALAGLAAGAGAIWFIGTVGSQIFGRDAMGGGDVKLLGAMGTILGWEGAIFTLFLAAFLGALVALVGLVNGRLRRNQYIPFGPFLNTAGVMLLFYLCSRRDLLSLLE